eukprot:Platyproteum_vivax@DN4931_c0_g1_i1.p2
MAAFSLEKMVDARVAASAHRSQVVAREGVKSGLLNEARIVCSTLSVCGSRDLTSVLEPFDTVIVDEASQGVEVATLIPLKLGGKRLILIGDPKQLPATVFSKIAEEHGYGTSLFQRLQAGGCKVNMLTIQYRMHPEISRFPSKRFYNNELLNAENILELCGEQVFWQLPCFRPAMFFHVGAAQQASGSSLLNTEEAAFVVHMIETLHKCFPSVNWTRKIAVISPYLEQVRLLRR